MHFSSIVCSQVEHSPPDVEIQIHHPNITVELYANITVELYETVKINCTIRNIGKRGKAKWKYNDSMISSSNVETINGMYNDELCGFISTIIITNFTIANEGLYICSASQPDSSYSSDSIYILIDTVPLTAAGMVYACSYLKYLWVSYVYLMLLRRLDVYIYMCRVT